MNCISCGSTDLIVVPMLPGDEGFRCRCEWCFCEWVVSDDELASLI